MADMFKWLRFAAVSVVLLAACVSEPAVSPDIRQSFHVADVTFEAPREAFGDGSVYRKIAKDGLFAVMEKDIRAKFSAHKGSTPIVFHVTVSNFAVPQKTGFALEPLVGVFGRMSIYSHVDTLDAKGNKIGRRIYISGEDTQVFDWFSGRRVDSSTQELVEHFSQAYANTLYSYFMR